VSVFLKILYNQHTLVVLWFFLNFSFSIIGADHGIKLALHTFGFLFLFMLDIKKGPDVFKRIKTVFYFFPVLLIFYVGFSLLFAQTEIEVILWEAGLGFVRLLLILGIMALFFENIRNEDLLTVLRSIWIKFNLSWKWVENAFIFLGMTLRFYPEFQKNWETIREGRKGFGFKTKNSFKNRLIKAVEDLPGLLLLNLRRAEDISTVMELRGYGSRFPRGITFPVPFSRKEIFKMIFITLTFWLVNNIAAF